MSLKKKFHDLKSHIVGGTIDKEYDKTWSIINKHHKRISKLQKLIKNFNEHMTSKNKFYIYNFFHKRCN